MIIDLLELLLVFFTIGLFTIGGGYAMIPMIQDQVVARGWLTQTELLDFLAVSESTPGPFAVNMATFVGFSQAGVIGGVLTTIAVVLPSFIIILIIAKFISKFQDNKYVKAVLAGMSPMIVGLLLGVVIDLLLKNILPNGYKFNELEYKSLIIVLTVFITTRLKKIHPIIIILMSGVLGFILYYLL